MLVQYHLFVTLLNKKFQLKYSVFLITTMIKLIQQEYKKMQNKISLKKLSMHFSLLQKIEY